MDIRKYINSLMRDEENGAFHNVMKCILWIVSIFYGGLILIWDFVYSRGFVKSYKSSFNVISVGNLTVGGTGKTPFVIKLAQKLGEKGPRISVLVRGYGDDEWRLIHESLGNVPVLIGRDRVKSARSLEAAGKVDTLILDDGYQHRALKRNANILLIDAANPFGNGCLFPRGILREPKSAIKYADIIVLTKTDIAKYNVQYLRDMLGMKFGKTNIFDAVHKPVCFFDIIKGGNIGVNTVKNKKICALSGIADSAYFRYIIKHLGGDIIEGINYGDHYSYTAKDLDYIQNKFDSKKCEFIITTEKDWIKLKKLNVKERGLKILVLRVEIEIVNGMEVFLETVSGLCRGNGR
jgi:tetraacyldisaccharide 4'-kinase